MSGIKPLAIDLNAVGVSPEKFAADAAAALRDNERVEVEASAAGAILRGVWELDVDLAIEELKEALAVRIEWSPPLVLYKEGSRLLEPIMNVRLAVPDDSVGEVMADLVRRRSTLLGVWGDDEGYCRIDGLAPLANLFGYLNTLRQLTKGRGKVDVDFHGYQHVPPVDPGPDPNEPAAAALRAPRSG